MRKTRITIETIDVILYTQSIRSMIETMNDLLLVTIYIFNKQKFPNRHDAKKKKNN